MIALLIADLALIPVQPTPFDAWGAQEAVSLAQEARRRRKGKRLPLVSLVPYRTIHNRLSRDLPAVLADLGETVAPGVGNRTPIVEAAIVGRTVTEYAPRSKAADEVRKLARHVTGRLGRI